MLLDGDSQCIFYFMIFVFYFGDVGIFSLQLVFPFYVMLPSGLVFFLLVSN